jgi:acetyl esterase/lipase
MNLPRFVFGFLTLVTISHAVIQRDVEYGKAGGESLKLDLSVPEGNGPFPAVILVHGGGWNAGDKSGGPKKGYMAPMDEPLSKAGFAWFEINYRLTPKHPFPANIEDVETAIRWVKSHAAEYHLDPKRIALSGESAGGTLVALAAMRADDSTRMAAIIPFYGRHDLTEFAPGAALTTNIAQLCGRTHFDDEAERILTQASPLKNVKPGLPPFLLVHGTADATVPFAQSENLLAALRKAGVKAELLAINGGVHGMLGWEAFDPQFKQKVVAWLQKTLKVQPKAELR